MRSFAAPCPALRTRVLFAGVLALLSLALAAPPAVAQGVKDSVGVSFRVSSYFNVTQGGAGLECGSSVLAEHPDFANRAANGYAGYSYGPYRDIVWYTAAYSGPGMRKGGLNAGASWGAGPYDGLSNSCGYFASVATSFAATLSSWAVYTYPNGTPVAKFDTTRGDGLTMRFDGTASFEAVDGRKVPVASYRWAFGDPNQTTVDTSPAPSHTYAEPGRYLVTLEVTDDDGQTDQYSRYVAVSKPGLVVWAEALDADQTFQRGDAIAVVAYVENRSDEEVTDVRVPLGVSPGTVYPDSILRYYKQPPAYKRVGARRDTTIAFIGPGERVALGLYMSVDGYAVYRPRTRDMATAATGYAMLLGVTGKDAQGQAVPVEQKCGFNPCGHTWKVVPSWVARAEFRTDNRVTFQVQSGVRYNPDLGAPDLASFNFPRVQPFTFQFVDGTLTRFCHSACADIRVVVTDSLHGGAPVKDATVVVTVPTLAAGVGVTPDQGGGHVCVRGTASHTCAKTVTVKTNDRGETPPMYYAFPGLDAPTEATVEVLVKDGSTLLREPRAVLRLLPTERTDFTRTITIGQDEAAWLTTTLHTVTAGTAGNAAGEFCEGYVKFLGGANETYSFIRPSTSSVLHRGRNLLAEWICTLNPFTIWGQETAGNAKKIAETALIGWFGARFIPPDAALGTLNGPYPPPFVFYWDGDYYGALLDALKGAAPQIAPGATMTLRLFEVSWLQKETVFNGQPMVPNAYFSLTTTNYGTATHTALLELGYDAETWQTPLPSERLAVLQQAEAERLRLQESLERLRRGDFVTLGAGTPTEETVQVTGVSEGGTPVQEDASGTPSTTRLQRGPYEVTLSRRLRFAHPAGDSLVVTRDTLGVALPMAPLRLSLDSVATTRPVTLSWRIGAFETPETVDVQAARDTAFATLVLDAPGLDAATVASVEAGRLADGERLYWRTRAANRVGVGPWSRPALVIASDAITTAGTAVEAPDAGAVTLSAPSPNPTSGRASVAFALPTTGAVRLSVYDLLGREVAVLVDETRAAGRHVAAVPAATLSPGVYVVRLVAGAERRTQRLVVVR